MDSPSAPLSPLTTATLVSGLTGLSLVGALGSLDSRARACPQPPLDFTVKDLCSGAMGQDLDETKGKLNAAIRE